MRKYWINSNNNDYIIFEKGLYFLVYREKIVEKGFTSFKNITEILTENEFKTVKGFVPIKQKKLRTYMKNSRFGEWFGHLSNSIEEIEEAKMRLKQEFREERLKKLLEKYK